MTNLNNFYIFVNTNIGDYMINNYEIKIINNEEVLYIYMDFDYEFAKLKSEDVKKKLNEMIKDYLNEHKIKFNGKTACIIAGGLLIGTLALKVPQNNVEIPQTNNYAISLISSEEINNIYEEVEEVEEKVTTDEVVDSVSKKTITSSNSEVKNSTSSSSVKEESSPILDSNQTYVVVNRQNGSTVKLELEEYLVGVVGAEMPASFHEEALKAQAIIARTYTLKALQRGLKLTDNNSTQNYKSNIELQKMWKNNYNTYYQKIKNAVDSTKGMYLTYNGEYIDAVYHSTSNGKTENSEYVWGNAFPYLVSVESPYDTSNSSFYNSVFIPFSTLSEKLQLNVNINTFFNIISKTTGGRVNKIEIDGKSYTGVEIRNMLGLRSADFELDVGSEGVIFKTRGYGHGVGMSQYGANGMAKNGYNYAQILNHYYKEVVINQR